MVHDQEKFDPKWKDDLDKVDFHQRIERVQVMH